MSRSLTDQLATLLSFQPVAKAGPHQGLSVAGQIEGFPALVGYHRNMNLNGVTYLVRFKKGTLSAKPDSVLKWFFEAPSLLEAMGAQKIGNRDRNFMKLGEDHFYFFRPYSFKAPKPEQVTNILQNLVLSLKKYSTPLGVACESCGSGTKAELFAVGGTLMNVCNTCRARIQEEDRQAQAHYARKSSNPFLGTIAGIAVALTMAFVWGALSYYTRHIYSMVAIGIGLAIAFAVNKGMAKVTWYGRILAPILTVGSVLFGDYLFILFSISTQQHLLVTKELMVGVLNHFFQIEFGRTASGYISVFFGLVGAMVIYFSNRSPVTERVFIPIGRMT